ncbi:hypothetical protein [Sporisorium scitamineum]|uniref:Uncharacterized protein n=1 Tax=Sporisorium scitamineum TaxID=49012 RepID=A0A0F7RWY4_9BASI|nr:hypothetical protein [Sporisorium scitamineum]
MEVMAVAAQGTPSQCEYHGQCGTWEICCAHTTGPFEHICAKDCPTGYKPVGQ